VSWGERDVHLDLCCFPEEEKPAVAYQQAGGAVRKQLG